MDLRVLFIVLSCAGLIYILCQIIDVQPSATHESRNQVRIQCVNISRQKQPPKLHPWVRVYDLHKYNNDTFDCVPLGARTGKPTICIHPVNVDQDVSANIKKYGLYEKFECNLFQDILQQNPAMNVADLGANLGQYSMLAANMGRKVLAIDPMLENVQRFHRSALLNGFQNNITLVMNGLSDVHTILKFTRIHKNIGATRVSKLDERGFNEKEYGIGQIRSVLLDDLIPLCHSQTLFIKMDIEGSEVRGVRGGKHFFNQNDVRYVLMEISHHYSNPEIYHLFDFFISYGLEPHTVHMQKLDVMTFTTWAQENVLWIKKST